MQLQRQTSKTGFSMCQGLTSSLDHKENVQKRMKARKQWGLLFDRRGGRPTATVHTIPRLTVSLTLPLSSSSRNVSADSRDVAAMSRPKARWDMKRRETSSASVCMTFGITTFMYMLPSKDRIDASVRRRDRHVFKYWWWCRHKSASVCACVCVWKQQIPS